MRTRIFTLNPRTPDRRRLFSRLFLAWLFLDLCVVHMLHPQYAAAELFGCAVPAVVAAPSADLDATSVPAAAPAGLETAERSLPAHVCLWNTQSLLDAPTIAPPTPYVAPLVETRPTGRSVWYARVLFGDIFHPPRLA